MRGQHGRLLSKLDLWGLNDVNEKLCFRHFFVRLNRQDVLLPLLLQTAGIDLLSAECSLSINLLFEPII